MTREHSYPEHEGEGPITHILAHKGATEVGGLVCAMWVVSFAMAHEFFGAITLSVLGGHAYVRENMHAVVVSHHEGISMA